MNSDVSSATTDGFACSTQSQETARQGIFWVYPERRFDVLQTREATFGRAPDCDYSLNDTQVSRVHASGRRHGAGCELLDRGSRNGTYVNGQRTVSSLLSDQDVVRIGGWVGIFTSLFVGEDPLTPLSPGVIVGARALGVYKQALRVAQTSLPVLISGETGTGKEVLAQSLHRASGRSGAFVAVNCAALPEALAEGELFGYRKGAFTGANQPNPGHFRSAERGTLLLDEIADLPASIQAKLLRILEERAVVPLGESRPVPVDVRILSAGQGSLKDAVAQGRFRADLYARLRGLELVLPPLRQRREEVVPIFLYQVCQAVSGCNPTLSPELTERLCTYDWPLNVREVVQVARQMAILHHEKSRWGVRLLPDSLLAESLPTPSLSPRSSDALQSNGDLAESIASDPALRAHSIAPTNRRQQAQLAREQEVTSLLAALERHGGNVSRAAADLGISRQRAYRLLEHRPDVNLNKLRR